MSHAPLVRRAHDWHPLALAVVLALVAGVRSAAADWNPTPIALPLLGTEGVASPYPSSITVTAVGGPAMRAAPTIVLHNVTHPCPEDLVVLLVHDGVGHLLLSGAGGCRPLQGTSIEFGPRDLLTGRLPLPDADSGPPHGANLSIARSVYGVDPVLPAPAPAGPYVASWPSLIEGRWDLYIVDRVAANRGVVAAGWSIHYPTRRLMVNPGPVTTPEQGPAPAMDLPIIAAPTARVRQVLLGLQATHHWPDDFEIVLQSPSGTSVVVMNDAGGNTSISGVDLAFADSGATPAPDGGPLVDGALYRPGGSYGSMAMATPPGPHATAFSAFAGEPVAGTWRLFVNDDEAQDAGQIAGVNLLVETEFAPIMGIDTPTSAATFTATQSFVRVAAEIEDLDGPYAARWRNVVDGAYYASGAMRFGPSPSDVIDASIPLKRGANVVTVTVKNVKGDEATDTLTITVPELVYHLTEGATGGFFDTDVSLFNPTGTAAPVALSLLPETGPPTAHAVTLPGPSDTTLRIDDLVAGGGVSTIVRSTSGVPLAVERTMTWDSAKYGGHGGTAVDGAATRWLFAEGAQGFFDTYLLLANDNAAAVTATVRFLRESGGPIVLTPSLPPHSRTTIWAGSVAGLAGASFGIDVAATAPIAAERAMYFPSGAARPFEGGTGAAGVTAGSTTWFLAEGATGPFFECFILVSNPGASPASVTFTYLRPTGPAITRTATVPANGRLTVNVETVDPALLNTPVSTTVTSDRPVVVERAMYWPDFTLGWQEAHASFGITELGLAWALADGRVGGPEGYETYVLLANPNATPAEVEVRFVKAGSAAAPVLRTYTLNPSSRRNIAVSSDVAELGAGSFGVEVRVLNFQPIAVEKAMYWNAGATIWAGGTGVTASRLPPP